MLPVRYRPGFESDALTIYDWYEAKQPGLGKRFLSALKQICDSVETEPCSFTPIEEAVRVATLPHFPYGVYFEVFEAELVIFAVIHLQREPSN